MENRWSRRKDLLLDVAVYSSGQPLGFCHAINIGLGGLQMDVGSMSFTADTQLDLEFRLSRSGQELEFRVCAAVMHLSGNLIGVRFLKVKPDLFHTIHSQLYGTHTTDRPTPSPAHYTCLH